MGNKVQPSPSLDDLRTRRSEILRLAEQRGAFNVRVFGSVARGEARVDSDIDLLVDFQDGATLWDAVGLWQDLQEFLGRSVSLITEDNRDTRFIRRVLKEAVPL
ncbi:MAG: nucleotidyltransferase family protein [Chloroflexi bacterium]|nr:nucleotidyltransferase family protein [Chloroflexota bacterium]